MGDGVELFYRAWLPPGRATKAVFVLHRGHEHSGRLSEVADSLLAPDTAVFAWDARGHGRSPGRRGYTPSFTQLVRDLDSFVHTVTESHGICLEDTVVVGQSVGAVTAAAWVHDFAPPIRSLVLVTPALRIKLYVPFAMTALRLWDWFRRGEPTFLKSYVKARFLTHDRREQKAYRQDPLITRDISLSALLGLYDAGTRLLQDAAAIRVPTLLLAGGRDHVVRLDAQQTLFDRLGSSTKKMHIFKDGYHDLFHEENRREVLASMGEFVRDSFARDAPREPLTRADRSGHTRREVEKLLRPLPIVSWKGLGARAARGALQTVGRLSHGIRLGWKTGFDSGQSLDYVYQNRARGASFLGRWIDRWYLDSVGWKGIRQRKVMLEETLRHAIARWQSASQPVHVMDIAAGPGRYVLDVLGTLPPEGLSATLRDSNPDNAETGRRLVKTKGLRQVTFDVADAFDRRSLAAVRPRPNIAIASGLYELYSANDRVLGSLQGIAEALGEGGFLIYTNQPWHPQLETIARTLSNRDGAPWVMRRRTQEEMDDLVRAAGFDKVAMEIDDSGIFTVSLARIGRVA
ncbi:MAG: bifunctional alpha/beta hydrolase/class I SAM-dependent methyltransferase [Deltaproteobacteria bacterium]|nr:bifunctional alpha/beta hydrolase/class I SAM-dependent methyltransferase [Deltaproteobacteria bacterium]